MTETLKKAKLEIEIRESEIPAWRAALGTIREKKGLEDVTISLTRALRSSFESLGRYGEVVNLDWEEFLSSQHIVMNEMAKPQDNRDADEIKRGMGFMEESANRAHAYIISHEGLEEQEKKSYRFLGRLADYKGDYSSAIANYKKAIDLFDSESDPMIRVNELEISGFLAFSMIMNGELGVGVVLAKAAFYDFGDSDEGKQLKESDYYTWAVWASGIPIRTVGALLDKGESFDKNWALGWIKAADELLVIPPNDKSWGDKSFSYRKDEIAAIRRRLQEIN